LKLFGLQGFFVKNPNGRDFPWDDYKTILTDFLVDDKLWKDEKINRNLKQEHICVLFYIAALRYITMPIPVFEKKYEEETNEAQNLHTDLFLFSIDRRGRPKVAYAVQTKVLTKIDIDLSGQLTAGSDRAGFYSEKKEKIKDFKGVRQRSIEIAGNFCKKSNDLNADTFNFVVNITPYDVYWDDCGRYQETVSSVFIKLSESHSKQKVDVNDPSFIPHASFASQNNDQIQSSQNISFGILNQQNSFNQQPFHQVENPYLAHFSQGSGFFDNSNLNLKASPLKPSTSYSQDIRSPFLNQNSQNLGWSERVGVNGQLRDNVRRNQQSNSSPENSNSFQGIEVIQID